jgi:pimeloyl-ACP methyl ester carboxylesterase
MPQLVEIPDPVAGADARGRMRIDRRAAERPTGAPPLVLVGGMTQTLASWGAQTRPLAQTREVIVVETRGQGTTELDVRDATLPRHVADLCALLDALGVHGPVDVCGFSFGARVCMGLAAERPERVRKLATTGVALDRGVVGRLIVRGWLSCLRTGDLEALARTSLPDILGPRYLEAHAHQIEAMVEAAVARNRYDGVAALMRATTELPEGSPWRSDALAVRIRAPAWCAGGSLDRLAPPGEVAALAAALGGRHVVFPDCGHTVPIESPERWRAELVDFLDGA